VLPVVERGYLVGQVTARELLELELRERPDAKPVTAADVMSEPAVTITRDDPLLVAVGLMAEHQLRHLPVIEAGLVIGMLSDRDVRTAVGDPVRFITGPEAMRLITVRDAMTGPAITVAAQAPLTELATEFADDKLGALPVVDRERKLLGVVSYVDVLRALAERK
ncbi:MAG TPA: CBS domain-containing protein, partial [Kofleriaceae bacterium]|nr:CBS domain-containing protein [Kofleriaceae bacterium]